MFCVHLGKFQTKKSLKVHLELNFNNFQERKNNFFYADCYDILTFGNDIIGFDINIISDLGCTITFSLFLLQILSYTKIFHL